MGRTSTAKDRLIEAMIELIWIGSYGSTSVDQIYLREGRGEEGQLLPLL